MKATREGGQGPLGARLRALLVAIVPVVLASCGGGGDSASGQSAATQGSDGADTSSKSLTLAALPGETASANVLPSFYLAPVALAAPGNADAKSPGASALKAPASQAIGDAMASVSSARLTPQAIAAYAAAAPAAGTGSTVVTTYTPAQIRAAYGLPALPTSWTGLSAAQAAQMGAGQTIYIVDAMSDPNAAAELAAFSQTFGLPACTTTAISSSTPLPLPAASTTGCQFSVVYSTSAGGRTSTPPAYDSGWATEIALDVQWAHATAPLARIVLIEAPDASIGSLLGAVNLANAMGPGIVSMSFGATEGSWTASVDSAFSSTSMSYVAATGDSGSGVEWPSVSKGVLGVGGTHLTYSGTTRSETVWSGTGGGISQYTSAPAYQTSAVPGLGTLSRRSVADVAFNADPYSGQYLAVIAPGSSSVSWHSAGGTSLATPQWAGLLAIANAVRAQSGQGVLGLAQNFLYSGVSTRPSLYASVFSDITQGSDGTCSTCAAHVGYDQPSGLGTPNVTSLLTAATTSTQTQAPVVTPITVNGQAGSPLSFSVAVTAPHAVTWSLANAPQGMTIGTSGTISWPKPVAGTYTVNVTATDSTTRLSGSAAVTVIVVAPSAPTVDTAAVAGQTGRALQYQVSAHAPNPVTFSMSGAPSGMSIGASTGLITWPAPVAGSYRITVTATDTKTGLSGSGVLTVQVTTATKGPVISVAPINGVAGKAVSGVVGISDASASYITVNIRGVPAGMTLQPSGQGILLNWANPVAGTYTLVFTAIDSNNLSAQANLVVTISAR
ncbi:S53 family peptidase [Ralstonia solanacearum]|uniref:S53 family peptidase n=1 Tax=Ralstonia solanacearum TaxID=305 RepID=UPI0001D938D2|nr:S53 family peptidase [Ralstonia solanacearum]CBJ50500.1 conserved hypothethical protein, Peptidase S8 and S53 domain [Ralstonia solanacearum PSI07]